MDLLPGWAPNIHPVIIHFPIAIILLGVAMNFFSLFLPERWWDELKTTILYSLGTITAIGAYYTGTLAADSVFMPSGAQSVLNSHASWAWWTVWFMGAYILLRILLHFMGLMDRKNIRVMALIAVLPGIFFLYETGGHGAEMVFGYGVGTGQLIQQEPPTVTSDSLISAGASTFIISDNGDWRWPVGPQGVSTLLSRFRWLEGSIQDLQPSVVSIEKNQMLEFAVDSTSIFFVDKHSYRNVQVDYYLDISEFKGEVSLVNHVQGPRNYDFVTLSSEGTITQGRVVEGKRKIFAEEKYSASGLLFIRTVGNGTHFRAYINKEMAVHGHGDAPEPGSIGLKMDGSGTILLDKIVLTQL